MYVVDPIFDRRVSSLKLSSFVTLCNHIKNHKELVDMRSLQESTIDSYKQFATLTSWTYLDTKVGL